MVTWLYLLMAVPAGFVLGVLFFGGLWWTVRKISAGSRPAPLMIASFLVRSAALLAGLYLLMDAGWQYLPAALVGFLAARTALTYKLGPAKQLNRPGGCNRPEL